MFVLALNRPILSFSTTPQTTMVFSHPLAQEPVLNPSCWPLVWPHLTPLCRATQPSSGRAAGQTFKDWAELAHICL